MYIVIFYVNFGLFISVCVCVSVRTPVFRGNFWKIGRGGGREVGIECVQVL